MNHRKDMICICDNGVVSLYFNDDDDDDDKSSSHGFKQFCE